MAWTERLPSGNWRGLYRSADGRRLSAGTYPHADKALAKAIDAEEAAHLPGWRDPRAAGRKWGDWCAEWLSARSVEDQTSQADRSALKCHIIPYWRDVPLADVTRFRVKQFAKTLAEPKPAGKGLAPSSVKRTLAVFSSSISAAVDAEILVANPCFRLGLEPGETDIMRFFTRKQIGKWLKKLRSRPEDAAMLAVLVGCGLRWGEMAGLRPERVDLKRRMLRVSHTKTQAGDVKKYTKSRKIRDVPIPPWVVEMVRPYVKRDDEFVFARTNSSNWRRDVWNDLGTGGRIHDLRHTYASWLLQDGVKLAEVSKLMGHSSSRVTERYAHIAKVPQKDVDKALRDPRK